MLRRQACRMAGGVRLVQAAARRRAAERIADCPDRCGRIDIGPLVAAASLQVRSASTSAGRPLEQQTSPLPFPVPVRNTPASSTSSANSSVLPPSARSWVQLGLNDKLSRQIASAFPHITAPTTAQNAAIRAMQKQADVILRAHTGTGKSFGVLLALLNMPRLTVVKGGEKRRAISSIIIVPSRELAMQYEHWARQLFPPEMHGSLSHVIRARYRSREVSVQEHLDSLTARTPHVLVITAPLLQELLKDPIGCAKIGIHTLRTLVLDEADALLDLPDRFPSQKQIWNHMKHPPAGLAALDIIMRQRSTFSGGLEIPSSGLEKTRSSGPLGESARRNAHRGAEQMQARRDARAKSGSLALPLPRVSSQRPLQLVAMSATANSVLRHFFGSRTGWLRTGLRNEDGEETGKWIDVTGQSKHLNKADEVQGLWKQITRDGEAKEHLQLPRELQHSCVIIDEAGDGHEGAVTFRDLDPSVAHGVQIHSEESTPEDAATRDGVPFPARETEADLAAERHVVAPTNGRDGPLDVSLLMALAQMFASQGVKRGVAFIPPSWSIAKTQEYLEQLEVPVVNLVDATTESIASSDEVLYLMQSTVARGLDIPGGVSHVFNLGIDAVRNTKLYTHLAGRAGRIGRHVHESTERMAASASGEEHVRFFADKPEPPAGPETAATSNEQPHRRAPGDVITLVRGLSTKEVRHNMRRRRLLRELGVAGKGASRESKAAILASAKPTETPNSSTPVPATRLIVAASELKMARIYRYLSLGLRNVLAHAPVQGEAIADEAKAMPVANTPAVPGIDEISDAATSELTLEDSSPEDANMAQEPANDSKAAT